MARLDVILGAIPTLDVDVAAAAAHAGFVAQIGSSRRTRLDRMIAAQALVHRATLVTRTVDNCSGIPGLSLLCW